MNPDHPSTQALMDYARDVPRSAQFHAPSSHSCVSLSETIPMSSSTVEYTAYQIIQLLENLRGGDTFVYLRAVVSSFEVDSMDRNLCIE